MKQDLSCPIELQGCTLSHNESSAQASVCLYNNSARRIALFEAVLKWRSSASGRSIAAPYVAQNLRISAEKCTQMTFSTARLPDADHFDIVFTTVQFDDDVDDWHAGSGTVVDISPIQLAEGEDLTLLQAAAGSDAKCFPSQDEQAWRCVCGRVNVDCVCTRCSRRLSDVIGFTRDNVLAQHEAKQAAAVHEIHPAKPSPRAILRKLAKRVAIMTIGSL